MGRRGDEKRRTSLWRRKKVWKRPPEAESFQLPWSRSQKRARQEVRKGQETTFQGILNSTLLTSRRRPDHLGWYPEVKRKWYEKMKGT
jgi:hypothetical protein